MLSTATRMVALAIASTLSMSATARADWARQALFDAAGPCSRAIERQAKFDFEWQDGWLTPKFSRIVASNEDTGYVLYSGNVLRLQNGFGAWQRYSYQCEFNAKTKRVISVDAWPTNSSH